MSVGAGFVRIHADYVGRHGVDGAPYGLSPAPRDGREPGFGTARPLGRVLPSPVGAFPGWSAGRARLTLNQD